MKRLLFIALVIFFGIAPIALAMSGGISPPEKPTQSSVINGSFQNQELFFSVTGFSQRLKISIPTGRAGIYIKFQKPKMCNRKNPPDCNYSFSLKESGPARSRINNYKPFMIRVRFANQGSFEAYKYRCFKKEQSDIACFFIETV